MIFQKQHLGCPFLGDTRTFRRTFNIKTGMFEPLFTNAQYKHRSMMTSSNGHISRVTGPLCGEFTGHRWIPLTKASDVELWCFLWSGPWINGWVNNSAAGDLRRHRVHCDVIVMGWHHVCLTNTEYTNISCCGTLELPVYWTVISFVFPPRIIQKIKLPMCLFAQSLPMWFSLLRESYQYIPGVSSACFVKQPLQETTQQF